MAEVIQCDKCGKICTHDESYTVEIIDIAVFDLCPDCKDKLIEYLENRKEN